MLKESINNIKRQLCDTLKGSVTNIKGLSLSVKSSLTDLIFKKLGNWQYSAIFLILILSATLPFLLGTIHSTKSIPSGGIIKAVNVEVYSNSDCTIPLTSITWGVLEPGDSESSTIYIKNKGNSALTLVLDTDGWSPSAASDYLDLTWDYTGEALNSGESISVVLTLAVSTEISGIEDFTFNIIIIGTG